jgi:hypothetical protein
VYMCGVTDGEAGCTDAQSGARGGRRRQGPLEKVTYARVRPVAHDINLLTRSADRLDVAVAMSNGEVLVHNPFAGHTVRLNKSVRVSHTPARTLGGAHYLR